MLPLIFKSNRITYFRKVFHTFSLLKRLFYLFLKAAGMSEAECAPLVFMPPLLRFTVVVCLSSECKNINTFFLCALLITYNGKIEKKRHWTEFKIHSSDIHSFLHTEQLHNISVIQDTVKHNEYNVCFTLQAQWILPSILKDDWEIIELNLCLYCLQVIMLLSDCRSFSGHFKLPMWFL